MMTFDPSAAATGGETFTQAQMDEGSDGLKRLFYFSQNFFPVCVSVFPVREILTSTHLNPFYLNSNPINFDLHTQNEHVGFYQVNMSNIRSDSHTSKACRKQI